jgi:two-component system, NarL family, response regulator NreC
MSDAPEENAPDGGVTIRLALVDDHAMLRDGLRALLDGRDGITVVGEASSLAQARARLATWDADVVLLDLALGHDDGLTLLEAHKLPTPAFIVLSMIDAPDTIDRALRAGARGYVLKGRSGELLVAAIIAVARGEVWLDEAVARHVLQGYLREPEPASVLTTREAEVVALVAAGWTSAEAARDLGVAVKTVQNHRSNALDKLGLRTTAALVRWAMANNAASDRPPPA